MRYRYRHTHCQSAGSVRRKVFLTLGMIIVSACAILMPGQTIPIVAAGCVINLAWLWS